MKTNKRNHVIIALVVFLLAISIGYAVLSATLNINGTATGNGKWEVKFTEAKLLQEDGTTPDTTHGTVTHTDNTVTATIDLDHPGDGVMLQTVIKNTGGVSAKLKNFKIEGAGEGLIIVNQAPTENEVLAKDQMCTTRYAIKWDPTAEELGEKTFTVTFEYEQAVTTEFNTNNANVNHVNS